MTKLRCRVGDIVVVIGRNDNLGRFGTVVRRLRVDETAMFLPKSMLHWYVEALGSQFSVTDPTETTRWHSDHVLANDAELMPLRDRPGQDEMLRITGKPKKPVRRTRDKENLEALRIPEVRS